MLKKINELGDKAGCVKYFSHLVNSQNKWMARIVQDEKAPEMSWWDPVYPFEKLEVRWNESLQTWINYLQSKTDEQIFEEVEFSGYDGGRWENETDRHRSATELSFHSSPSADANAH